MSIKLKMTIIVVLVALVPLTVSAITALRVHSRAYEQKAAELHETSAANLGRNFHQALGSQIDRIVAVSRPLPWLELRGGELAGALSLLYEQSRDIVSVQLVDAAGAQRGRPVFVNRGAAAVKAGHLPADHALVSTLRGAAMKQPIAPQASSAVADAVTTSDAYPLLPVRISVQASNEIWSLVVGLSLRGTCAGMQQDTAPHTSVIVVDPRGRRLCRGSEPLSAIDPGLFERLRDVKASDRFTYSGRDGDTMVAAARALDRGGWIVVQQPERDAIRPGRQMRNQTFLWIGASIAVALVAGLVLSSSITGPVSQLRRGAEELASGNLDYRVPATTSRADELAQLGTTFNTMSDEIQRQNREIQEWNETLQEKVEVRTRELKDAQSQLLRSQKQAAMNALAAGVAHEINNPLAGVLGLVQVLRMRTASSADDKTLGLIDRVEKDAQRIRDIVASLLALREEQSGNTETVQLSEIIAATTELVRPRLDEAGVSMSVDVDAELRVEANTGQLRTAFTHVINNAIAAFEDGGTIVIEAQNVEDRLARVVIRDRGRGIPAEHLARVFEPFYTTKSDWEGRGLGLALVHRIVEQHHGSIDLDSTVGVGTTVTIRLPLSAGGAHLT